MQMRHNLLQVALWISVLVPMSLAQAGELEELLALDVTSIGIVESYRAPDFDAATQRRLLLDTLWILRLEATGGGDEQDLAFGLEYSAITMDTTSIANRWSMFDLPARDAGRVLPSSHGAVVLFDGGDYSKEREALPTGSELRFIDDFEQDALACAYGTRDVDAIVLKRASGLFIQSAAGEPELRLTSDQSSGIAFSYGTYPNIASLVVGNSASGKREKLTVWSSQAALMYQDGDWSAEPYLWWFFAEDDRYVYFGKEESVNGKFVPRAFVLDTIMGMSSPLDVAVPIGRFRLADSGRFVLFTSANSDPLFASDALLCSLSDAPRMPVVWMFDSIMPILEGVVSADGKTAVLRALFSRDETELIVLNGAGEVVASGQHEPAGVNGLHFVNNEIIVSGAHLSAASPKIPSSGSHLFMYRVSGGGGK